MNVELFAKDVAALLEKHGIEKSEFAALLQGADDVYQDFNDKQGWDAWNLFDKGAFVVPVIAFATNNMETISKIIKRIEEDGVDFFHYENEDDELREYADLEFISSVALNKERGLWDAYDYEGRVLEDFMVLDNLELF